MDTKSDNRLQPREPNLECRLAVKGTDEQYAKLCHRGGEGVTCTSFGLWDPLYISEAEKARNYKFGMQIDHDGINEKCKIRPNWGL